ncbi:hypothetical protein JS528_08695 [Bifidobacterium sp. MA2]|uniref:Uncharacterized protein n=1 Tax=Bifidobacterium santillanense TaxID=2809028 RepID=A0ABS5URJ0_9BIFI|nr:hypothetical protein [Bifidobacterium santillanense]MBT1173423.1 hypothetical protein [Bifidobacterium santillanense]
MPTVSVLTMEVGKMSSFFYVMTVMLIVWILALALAVTVVVLLVASLRRMNREPGMDRRVPPTRSAPGIASSVPAVTPAVVSAARKRVVIGVAVGAVVLAAGLGINGYLPEYRYLPAALTPGLATIACLLTLAMPFPGTSSLPTPSDDDVRVASLRTREPWTYARRYVLAQPLLVAALLIVYLCFTMATASADDMGLMTSIALDHGDGTSASSGPYPGSYYAIPLIGVTLLLVGSTCAALWRVAHVPGDPDPRHARADRLWRVELTRFATFLSVGAMLAYASAVLEVAGAATWRLGTHDGTLSSVYADDVYPTLGKLQVGAGVVLLVVAAVYLILMLGSVRRLWLIRVAGDDR